MKNNRRQNRETVVEPMNTDRPKPPDEPDPVRHTESAMLSTRGSGPQTTAYVSATISEADGFGFYVQMLGQKPDAVGLAQLTEQAMRFMADALTRAQAAGLPLKGGVNP